MNLEDMIEKWKKGELVLGDINNLIQALVSERDEDTEQIPLWKRVLDQTEFYNGHGQLILSEITLDEAMQLCEDLSDHIEDRDNVFYLALFKEFDEEYYLSGSIYQSTTGKDIMWVSFERILK